MSVEELDKNKKEYTDNFLTRQVIMCKNDSY